MFSPSAVPILHHARQGVLHASVSELQAYEACVRFRKLADARGEEPGMRPVVKKNACGIWVKNALCARGEEFLPEAGMEREELQAYEACERFRKLADARCEEPGMRPVVKKNACGIWVKNALYAW